ncbi:hypothetical protein Q1695_015905 [Nippostrongylus brasiliensis]|nr:hypothetical protein Q1695_015905 [Nippostrongylus brasiliensis]
MNVAIRVLQLFTVTFPNSVSSETPCTTLTQWQRYYVEPLFHQYDMKFDCYCAERAEHLAYAVARNVRTDNYEGVYSIYTTIAHGRPLGYDSDQLNCMLNELFVKKNNLINRFIRINKGHHFACSYAKYPQDETKGNATMVLTCIFNKNPGRCHV